MNKHVGLLLGLFALGAMAGAKEGMVVLCPTRPEMFSQGEINVMIDAVYAEIEDHGTFSPLSRNDVAYKLAEKDIDQTDACAETACLIEAGEWVGAGYVFSLSIKPQGEEFNVTMTIIDVVSGSTASESKTTFDGPKTMLSLKHIPRTAAAVLKDGNYVKRFAPAARKGSTKAATQEPVAKKPPTPKEKAQAVETKPAPQPQVGKNTGTTPSPTPRADSGFRPAALIVPLVVAVPAVVAIVVLVNRNQGDSGVTTDDTMPVPPYPTRSSLLFTD